MCLHVTLNHDHLLCNAELLCDVFMREAHVINVHSTKQLVRHILFTKRRGGNFAEAFYVTAVPPEQGF